MNEPTDQRNQVVDAEVCIAELAKASRTSAPPFSPLPESTGFPGLMGVKRPVTWVELLALAVIVAIGDVALFRGYGYAGIACFVAVGACLMEIAASSRPPHLARWCVGGMLVLIVARLVWCGSVLSSIAGFSLLVAWTMTLDGQCPYVISTIFHAVQSLLGGFFRIVDYGCFFGGRGPRISGIAVLGVVLPLAALVVFGGIFIFANPDLADSVARGFERFSAELREWLAHVSFGEIAFCAAVFWLAAGLLKPFVTWPAKKETAEFVPSSGRAGSAPSAFFVPIRNTLAVVIVLFAVYLVFEFQSLWFRKFPAGFHYSGYAHRGAAWLTVALALSTGVLSLMFRGAVLQDPRLRVLKRLAWTWSVLNLVLAVAAFHRLYIYIGFNGLTRMRIIGMFGTASVVAGLLLVIWMIARHRSATWLVQRQMWALCVAVFIFSITPVDAIWVQYNVRRIMAGDPAPSVELSVHDIDSEGVVFLLPLLQCENKVIREGIRALLCERWNSVEQSPREPAHRHWTSFQFIDRIVADRLGASADKWTIYRDDARRQDAWKAFQDYAYQWY
jgi:hypothetical protein